MIFQGPVNVVNVGMLVHTKNKGTIVTVGKVIEPNYWKVGINYKETFGSNNYDIVDFSFFIDVRRPSSAGAKTVRLWQSNHGKNYKLDDIFSLPEASSKGVGGGSVQYANDAANVFDQKHSCGH